MKKLLLLLLLAGNCYAAIWQCVPVGMNSCAFYRMYVPSGWLIQGYTSNSSPTFYPDEKHEWRV